MPLLLGGGKVQSGGKTYNSYSDYKAAKSGGSSSSSNTSTPAPTTPAPTTTKTSSTTKTPPTTKTSAVKPNSALLEYSKKAGITDISSSGLNIEALNRIAEERLKASTSDMIPTASGGGVTSDSGDAKRDEEQLRKNISDNLESLQSDMERQIKIERQALDTRRAEELANINKDYDAGKVDTENAQAKETGQTSMDLARMGGFLGNTASHSGVLQNLAVSQKADRDRMENSRQDALRAANNAYEDRDFDLAREKLKLASDIEQEIYNRQQEFDEINRGLREKEQEDLKTNQDQVDIYNSITKLGEKATAGQIFKDLAGRVPIETINAFLGQMKPAAVEGDFAFSASNTASLLGAGMSRDEIQAFNDYINENGYDDKIRGTLTTAQKVAADKIFRDIEKTTGTTADKINEPLSILDIQRLEDTYGVLFPLGVTGAQATQFIKDNLGASAADMQAAIDEIFGTKKADGEGGEGSGVKIDVTEEWLRANLTQSQLKALADVVGASKWWTYKTYDIDRMFEVPEFFTLLGSKIQMLRDQGFSDDEILIALTS